eukprot:bmy_20741T0
MPFTTTALIIGSLTLTGYHSSQASILKILSSNPLTRYNCASLLETNCPCRYCPTIIHHFSKPKISIFPTGFNLTRKYLTKTHFSYSNKIFYTCIRPKRPNQTILPFIPHYPYPKHNSI